MANLVQLLGLDDDTVQTIMSGFTTVVVAVFGGFVGYTLGSLIYPVGGMGMLMGMVCGAAFTGLITCCATGFARRIMFTSNMKQHGFLHALMPTAFYKLTGGHGDFTLIVNIHKATNIKVRGMLEYLEAPDLFIEIPEFGANQAKSTCVRNGADCVTWNERFRLRIKALDDVVFFNILDQDIFGSTTVGFVAINIDKDILRKPDGWDKERPFQIQTRDGDILQRNTPVIKHREDHSSRDEDGTFTKDPCLYLSFSSPDVQLNEQQLFYQTAKGPINVYGSTEEAAMQKEYFSQLTFQKAIPRVEVDAHGEEARKAEQNAQQPV